METGKIPSETVDQLFIDVGNDIAYSVQTNRRVIVLILNETAEPLINPQVYVKRGEQCMAPMNSINPGNMSYWGFNKTSMSLYGTVGVVTYDMDKSDKQLCIYFCNPFKGKSQFALQWREHLPRNVGMTACNQMDEGEKWIAKSSITWESVHNAMHTLSGCMSEGDPAKLKVRVF